MRVIQDIVSKPLIVQTGKFTGRSPNDRYFVKTSKNKKIIDWGLRNKSTSEDNFQILYKKIEKYLSNIETFEFNGNVISDPQFNFSINLLTEKKWYTNFARNIFREDNFSSSLDEIQILHAPLFQLEKELKGIDNKNFVIIHPDKKIILIAGTGYAGEIKKSVFSLLNINLINHNILPMHCSANFDSKVGTILYFGLSGTGKTTLSSNRNKELIGDDEHGWSDSGVFNIEGGCYAKVIGLDKEKEPVIYNATHTQNSVIENVVLDSKGNIDFNDSSITENTRSCYSLSEIEKVYSHEYAPHPSNIFMLTCDAFGVLPPVSKLNIEQAVFHFITGYTAKIPGTESEIKVPVATFSPCFGGPFMPRLINDYANLFKKLIQKHQSKCWLINTGWWGGPYGQGKRIDLTITRQILNNCINNLYNTDDLENNNYFNLLFPSFLDSTKKISLNPINKWKNKNKYKIAAQKLQSLLKNNYQKIKF